LPEVEAEAAGAEFALGNADVAADGVLANFVDDKFLRDLGAMQVEEDRSSWRGLLLEQAVSEVRLTLY